ncbi:MAG: M12 family metallo-peptidase, partial [Verrucomicrobiota bacterium]|nr:M12 family metallo-peptidase [Verrucomicrobiota bacterium]
MPPLEHAPSNVKAKINGVPTQIYLTWKTVRGARNYEVQFTIDLSGATGWVTVPTTPGAISGWQSGMLIADGAGTIILLFKTSRLRTCQMRKLSVVLVILFTSLRGFAQTPLWQDVSPDTVTVNIRRVIVPDSYRAVRMDGNALRALLAQAPMEFTEAAKAKSIVLPLPMPNGKMARFRVQQSPISAPNPSATSSDFLSFSGQGIDDPTATLRCDISPAGFHAQILSTGESVYVDPFSMNDQVNCISYFRRDFHPSGERPSCFAPELLRSQVATFARQQKQEGSVEVANGSMLRSYASAFAATGEYTTFFRQPGDTDPQAKARALLAIKTTLNRVNGIWGRDVAVRYVLLSDPQELSIIYTDGATDPYTNSNANALLNENQTNLDNVIGDANYQHGHVFATSPGGVGGGAVCVTGQKAQGATGLPSPVGDPFDVDFVAHEIIHQWQGGHTFNEGMSGQCTGGPMGNRTPMTAFEPGSGSTVASYAGTCDSANLQAMSDDYFHSGSIAEILSFAANTATCATQTPTGNTPPTVTAPASFTVPQNTPFTLTASASDPDGDMLTYSWEEIDLGAASPPNSDDGTRPLFRPYKPTASPSRTFPSLPYILNNANTPPMAFTGTSATGAVCGAGQTCFTGEVMPVTTRTMQFRVTVRDNRAGGGGINDATTAVNVRADSGPFVVTAPNTAVTITGGTSTNVTWNVANTASAPVNAANVKISLSTDGGMSFPTVLAASTPNNGAALVPVPDMPTTTARIKVEAVGNIFFDISDTNFTITEGTPVPPATYTPLSPARVWDTRVGPGPTGQSGPGTTRTVQITGVGGVPATGVTAVVLNVAAINPTAQTFVTVWPTGEAQPLAANLNVPAGDVRPNLVIVKVGSGGQVNVFNNAGDVDFAADVAGWYGSTGTERYTSVSPSRVWDTRFGPGPMGRIEGGGSR